MDASLRPLPQTLLHPRHWPSWLALGLLYLLCLLPTALLVVLGEGLGFILGRLARSRRHIVLTNLRLCFPQMPETEREQLADQHFAALGAGLFEAGLCWFASRERLARRLTVEGLEHLDGAMQGGRGVLLLTGHFTCMDLSAGLVAVHRPLHPMYRPLNNPVMDWCIARWRTQRAGLPVLAKDDLKKIVRALREGHAVWYAPDQLIHSPNSVVVDFFAARVRTLSATSRLAQMGRAAVVPYFPRREGSRYVLRFYPALKDFPSGDEVADTQRINHALEAGIRLAPAQYFWVHRRFKTWDPAESDPYQH